MPLFSSSNLVGNSSLYIILFGLAVAACIGLGIWVITRWLKRANRISTRMDQFVGVAYVNTESPEERQFIPREISGSLFSRTILSWSTRFLNYLGRFTPKKMAGKLDHDLAIAGNPYHLNAANFFAIRLLFFIAAGFLAFLINRDLKNFNGPNFLAGVLIMMLSLTLPMLWLKSKVRSRQNEISLGMPDALDMLSVCASAGLGFDQSLQKISSYWDTELGVELKRVTQEMELGVSRSEALRNMSDRLCVDDLTQFIAIIIQAEKIGLSYADVLHSQAAQMRILRQLRAREIANKLPAKMIIPLVLFIFPAIIAVILGPAIPILLDLF